ncbi:hypothetical protein X744_23335 [Mesorhizobium sp. LNJC372A00]|nr:hypothetical protein X744_23335 [Mesorhizobium sp. LNJC372A00]
MPIEKRALLGEHQTRARAFRAKLNCRQRNRDSDITEQHVVAVDDALVGHDVLIGGGIGVDRPVLRPAGIDLLAADAKIHFVPVGHRVVGVGEPAPLGGRIAEREIDFRRCN